MVLETSKRGANVKGFGNEDCFLGKVHRDSAAFRLGIPQNRGGLGTEGPQKIALHSDVGNL